MGHDAVDPTRIAFVGAEADDEPAEDEVLADVLTRAHNLTSDIDMNALPAELVEAGERIDVALDDSLRHIAQPPQGANASYPLDPALSDDENILAIAMRCSAMGVGLWKVRIPKKEDEDYEDNPYELQELLG